MCSHGIYTPQCMLMRIIREHKWQLASYWKNGAKKNRNNSDAGSKDFQPEANAYQMEHVLDLLKYACDASYDFFFYEIFSWIPVYINRILYLSHIVPNSSHIWEKQQKSNAQIVNVLSSCVLCKSVYFGCVGMSHFRAMHSIGWHVFNRKPRYKNLYQKNLIINVKTLIKFNDQSTFQR